MHRSTVKRNETKRMDALLALPLDRFRRALTRLSAEELAALEARLDAQRMKHRLERGGFGIARHRAVHELALLARRESALRQEWQRRLTAAAEPKQLTLLGQRTTELAAHLAEKQAA